MPVDVIWLGGWKATQRCRFAISPTSRNSFIRRLAWNRFPYCDDTHRAIRVNRDADTTDVAFQPPMNALLKTSACFLVFLIFLLAPFPKGPG
jgi:hypothetical protein